MKRFLGKLLNYAGTGLLYMGAVVILVSLIFGWYKHGFGWVQDTFSPFNVWNFIVTIIVLGPGILLRMGVSVY